MEDMERCFGRIDGFLNYQGVLNTAQKIRGNEIFVDMLDEPEFAFDLFAHIEDTLSKLARHVQARQRASGVDIGLFSVSNCVVSMISPDMYEKFILPHDVALSRQFARFGMHTCNWNVTPYMVKLTGIEKIDYLDMSAGSDLEKTRGLFSDARLGIFFTPGDIEKQSLKTLENEFRRVAQHVQPCDIVFADMMPKTDVGKLNAMIAIAEKIEEEFA